MTDQEKKIVLVTGGAGFIGSFLCEELLKEGNRVICVDNFSTGHVRNIDPYLRNPDFQFLRQDITEPFDLESFPELEPFKVKFLGVQEIYHLAVAPSVTNFEKYRVQNTLVGSVGTRNILDMAVKYTSKVLLGSSSVVYGVPDLSGVFQEEYRGVVDHLGAHSAFDESRRFAETLVNTYAQVYGIDTKIARIFRAFGPRMPLFEGLQIPDFVVAALNGEDLSIQGTAETKTSLVYVVDIVSGLLAMMKMPAGTKPMNLGSDQNLLMRDVAQQVLDMMRSASKIAYTPPKVDGPIGLPDITRAKEVLGWTPVTRLEDGLQKTIDYIRANKILLTGGE